MGGWCRGDLGRWSGGTGNATRGAPRRCGQCRGHVARGCSASRDWATIFVGDGCRRRSAPGSAQCPQDQEAGRGRSTGPGVRGKHRHPRPRLRKRRVLCKAPCTVWVSPPKATTCWPMPRPSASAKACPCWWAILAPTLRTRRQRPAPGGRAGRHRDRPQQQTRAGTPAGRGNCFACATAQHLRPCDAD